MAHQTTPDDETSPLLGGQKGASCQTLAGNENSQKTDDKEAPRKSLVWILAAIWSAVFLGSLDGTSPRSSHRFLLDTAAFMQPQERLLRHYSPL